MQINRRGLLGTLIVHSLLLLLLILGGLTFPDPPPEEEGVLVNFGTDDSGFGNSEPAGSEISQSQPEADNMNVEEVSESYIPEQITPIAEQVDNTQDIEEVKVKEDPEPNAEDLQKEKEELQRQKEEEERVQKLREEEERIRKIEEEERLRQEAERRKQEEQANRLNSLGRNTFGNTGAGDTDGSEGVTSGDGNQGVETGSTGAQNYGNGSGLGNGPSYGLGTRKAVGELPLPNVDNCNVTSRIVVTVEIQVDRSGNVISASVSQATFADNCIWNVVVEAAKKTKFTADQTASFRQAGWIKYTIEP